MGVTFSVSDVQPGQIRIQRMAVPNAIHRLTTNAIQDTVQKPDGSWLFEERRAPQVPCEAWSVVEGGVAEIGTHPFIGAIQVAFDAHLPLELSPDQVWIVLAQGFAQHMLLHAEELRHQFVSHSGKLRLEVHRDEFRKGSPDNDWTAVFGEFSSKMHEHLGRRHDLIVADFSTTGPLERAVSQLVLMNSMQNYFEYGLSTVCGIPRITLLGEVEDWRSIRTRAQVFREFGMGDWLDALSPILDAFVGAVEGRVDREFWRSMYKLKSASGGPYLTGWSQLFFPYLVDPREKLPRQNPNLATWRAGMATPFGGGPTTNEFPCAMSSVPFSWNYLGTVHDMEFLGGFIGVEQDKDDLTVSPKLGWAVREQAQPSH